MIQKRKLTNLGWGVLVGIVVLYWVAGFGVTIMLKAPNADHDGYHHFTKATWMAFAAWWFPYVLWALIMLVRCWIKAGRPGIFEKVVEPVNEDLREKNERQD